MNCQTITLDPKLGTLVLGTGFTVLEAPTIPVNVILVERNGNLATSPLFALGTSTATSAGVGIFSLGTWPNLVQGALFKNLVSPADINSTTFSSNFLTSDGTSLLAGYTKTGTGTPGSLLVFSPIASTTTWVNAPGNYSATATNNRFIVNSTGLQSTVGTAIYGLNGSPTGGTGIGGAKLATFASAWMASSGVSAVSNNGVLIAGYFDGTDFENHLLAVAPSTYLSPLAGGTSFSLMGSLEVYAGGDVLNAIGFKDGVAIQRGDFPPPNFTPVTSDVVRFPLVLNGSGLQTISVGTMQTVVSAPNRCTDIDFIGHLGDDLLIAVKDRNGRRLVRVVAP